MSRFSGTALRARTSLPARVPCQPREGMLAIKEEKWFVRTSGNFGEGAPADTENGKNREEWCSQIAKAQEEFAQQQKSGKGRAPKQAKVETAGSMLMLGSTFTGDYEQMARRVQDGIYVKRFKTSEDEKVPEHLLPYRDHVLPKEYRGKRHDARRASKERGEVSEQRDSDQSRAPTPPQSAFAIATPRNAGTPRASSPDRKTGGRDASSTPHISQLSFTGGLGLEDTTDYAAMSRRRPEKGLTGKPISFLQLGLFHTLPEHERVQLLAGEQETPRTARDSQTPRARKDGRFTPREPHAEAMTCPPRTPRDDLRPRTSAGLMQREAKQGKLTAESVRPESAQVGGAERTRPDVTPRGHRKSSRRDEESLKSESRQTGTPLPVHPGDREKGSGSAGEARCLTAREAPRPRTSATTVFEPKSRAPDSRKNNVFGGVALSADMPRHPVSGALTERKTHAERLMMKAEWEKYLSGVGRSVVHDADALRARNRERDDSAILAIQKLDSFLARTASRDDASYPGGKSTIHGAPPQTPRASQTPRDGGMGAGVGKNSGARTQESRAHAAVSKLSQILGPGGGTADRSGGALLSARGHRSPAQSPLGPAPPKTARPDLGTSRPAPGDRQKQRAGSSSPAVKSPALNLPMRSADRPSDTPRAAADSNVRTSGPAAAGRATARPQAQELQLAKTTLGFMGTPTGKRSNMGGPRSIARRAGGTR